MSGISFFFRPLPPASDEAHSTGLRLEPAQRIEQKCRAPDVHSSFQTLMLALDGYPLKQLAIHKKLNYKLALLAAQGSRQSCPRKITRRSAVRYSEPSGGTSDES